MWKIMEKQQFLQVDTIQLGNYHMGGYGWIRV